MSSRDPKELLQIQRDHAATLLTHRRFSPTSYQDWDFATRSILHDVFGDNSEEMRQFRNSGASGSVTDSNHLMIGDCLKKQLAVLDTLIRQTELKQTNMTNSSSTNSKRIFLVHGHDNEIVESVARFVMRLGLEPLILREMPDKGRTVIEKLEDNSDVRFAIVLMTPDDEAVAKSSPTTIHSRARQNVILELGYFLGRLGRDRVCVINKGDLELPSDYYGVLLTKWEANWQMKLMSELKAAGFDIDTDRVLLASA